MSRHSRQTSKFCTDNMKTHNCACCPFCCSVVRFRTNSRTWEASAPLKNRVCACVRACVSVCALQRHRRPARSVQGTTRPAKSERVTFSAPVRLCAPVFLCNSVITLPYTKTPQTAPQSTTEHCVLFYKNQTTKVFVSGGSRLDRKKALAVR